MALVKSGADDLANALVQTLIAGKSFTLPTINLDAPMYNQPADNGPAYASITPLTVDALTTGQVGGSGVFDKVMSAVGAHLKAEYDQNRISGAEYTKAYQGSLQAALQMSVQFLLGKDQAYWQALVLQGQARAAEIEVIKTRVELEATRLAWVTAAYTAETAEATYALTKMKVATEDATVGNLEKQGDTLSFTNVNILPLQKNLLSEQVEATRAQTLDTRTDGAIVVGSVGKQKALYDQQITSYKRDAENKFAKLFTDAWITMKTMDEGLLPPDSFQNVEITAILEKMRGNLALVP